MHRQGLGRAGKLSVVASDMQITGTLRSSGQVQIDGIVNGDVFAPEITLGQSGTVIGALVAQRISLYGTLHGAIEGGQVTIGRTARIHARIDHDGLTIETGAILDALPPVDPATEI
jgi:cytoskeletal protein CcmA (bactofilin family)